MAKWITCDGGPHLFVPTEWSNCWSGTNPPIAGRTVTARFRWSGDPGAPATDYDAACDIQGLAGLVQVGDGAGLVLGDEVPMSTWLTSERFEGGLLVVPLEWSEFDDDCAADVARSVPYRVFVDSGLVVPVPSGECILCAAADSGPNWIYGTLDVSIPPGQYQVLSADTRINGFWLRLHGLRRTP